MGLPTSATRRASRTAPAWVTDVALLAVVALVTADIYLGGVVADIDRAVTRLAGAGPVPHGETVGHALFFLGDGTWLLRAAIAVAAYATWRTLRARSGWRVLVPGALVCAGWAAHVGMVGALKLLTDRGAPRSGDVSFATGGMSYPSGHASACALWYGLIAVLFGLAGWHGARRALWAARWPITMAALAGMVYVDFHWLSDAVVGVLLGTLALRLLTRLVGVTKVDDAPDDRPPRPPLGRR